MEFIRTGLSRQPGRFVRKRMEKYDAQSRSLKTSLFGVSMVVFCGPAANKFMFSNENKLVNLWWPSSVKKLMKSSLSALVGDEAITVQMHSRRMCGGWISPHIIMHVGTYILGKYV